MDMAGRAEFMPRGPGVFWDPFMPHDPSRRPDDGPRDDPLVSRPHGGPRPLLAAGVAVACLLGAGLGFWARPEDLGHGGAHHTRPRPQPAAPAPRRIEIRVDAAPAAPRPAAPKPQDVQPQPEALAPKRPAAGLIQAHAIAPTRLDLAPKAPPHDPAEHKARPAKAAAQAQADAVAGSGQLRLGKARLEKVRLEKMRLEKVRLAAASEARAHRIAERKAAARQAAAEKLQAARLVQARLEKARNAEALHAQALHPQARAAQARKLQAQAAHARSAPQVRLASASRCASADPGAALACADPALGAADRQLARAYRQAEAAGVPAERLQRQQQRWLAARAAAARQAPWAVHDVYLARIAELEDQTRQASTQGD